MSARNVPVGVYTDRSGTIAVANTSQQLVGANSLRRSLLICNGSTLGFQGIAAAESLWISLTGAAVVGGAGSIEIPTGTTLQLSFDTVPLGAVNIIATTIGHKFTCSEGQ